MRFYLLKVLYWHEYCRITKRIVILDLIYMLSFIFLFFSKLIYAVGDFIVSWRWIAYIWPNIKLFWIGETISLKRVFNISLKKLHYLFLVIVPYSFSSTGKHTKRDSLPSLWWERRWKVSFFFFFFLTLMMVGVVYTFLFYELKSFQNSMWKCCQYY